MADEYTATISELQVSLMRAQEEVARLRTCIKQIELAITVEGPVPQYHQHVMRKHRSEWSTLWKAIDEAIGVVNGK